ncbi:hypothetical protein L313_2804 [Acinetobacter haemolyticus CIP 64.3 = MTCC 9819]|uniref:Uncharacterized protein n=1 Tax=Acinetobacter haemolyticus CIP 64.3 = MTCC 9819 TaxID=1217659 RepID=N9GEM9_ACIHA|nr:hypothetical protein [Acinetobacter haemolyticus]ENW15621.1 hypothetical protein F927_03361 [Acinetobacter haemolyticus CIP 64.3 = MTCC 9819]EPR90394.1 hypothetical protein L313_2804 [Acinetobacter haemolyticus CIP 64.3 = MTCC 9819]QXZ26467.1 hypothetical protein I6L22_15055 [Acinetobacter haemolyticus]SPT48656.1 Uncharacterised protein [Acinetobacter haemolyticus]SUU61799.1 Uncharacterised protein [Acinetobacter haemolyticus]
MSNEDQNIDTANTPLVEQAPPVETKVPVNDAGQPPVDNQQPPADSNPPTEEKPSGTVPENADAYSVELEGFDMEAFSAHEGNKAFLEKAHSLGVSNEQMTAILEAYEANNAVNVESLQTEWGGEFNKNIGFAKQAIEAAGMNMDDADGPMFGIKMAAWIGKQLQEDLPPSNTQQNGAETVEQLMLTEAYSNANHPDHKSVAARVSQWFQKNTPE